MNRLPLCGVYGLSTAIPYPSKIYRALSFYHSCESRGFVACIVEQRSTLLVAIIAISSDAFFGQRPILWVTAIAEDWALPNNTIAIYALATNRVERCSTIHLQSLALRCLQLKSAKSLTGIDFQTINTLKRFEIFIHF